jgi:uncharacterized membrane protein YhaH (DUF805 family)
MNWYFRVLKKYAVFSGRARRREYWWFFLFNLIIGVGIAVIESSATGNNYSVLASLYQLAVFLPAIGVSIRRLHDTGRSGWSLLVGLIPLVGPIVLLIFMLSDSQPETNQYGPSPKAKRTDSTPTHSPLDTAKERYAGGELDKEQFDQIKKDLL